MTAEDVLLRKLLWYRAEGETSERHWSDILGVLRLRGQSLDREYLKTWASRLHVEDLLVRAEQQAS